MITDKHKNNWKIFKNNKNDIKLYIQNKLHQKWNNSRITKEMGEFSNVINISHKYYPISANILFKLILLSIKLNRSRPFIHQLFKHYY